MLEPHSLTKPETVTRLTEEAIAVLKQLISLPSFSREENQTADFLANFLQQKQVPTLRMGNNVWAKNKHFNPALPTILLNSHHDTVKTNAAYTLNPFVPLEKDNKLYGLGSNDAGGPLVSLMATFLHFYGEEKLNYNLIFAATAEEEISGSNGIASILPELAPIDFAIVGEPTQMNLAVSEKGLMVVDCLAKGTAAHVAHDQPDNAITKALADIHWINSYKFPNTSPTLGDIKMNVTLIHGGIQHNSIPDTCTFTIDIRTTDAYSNLEVLEILKKNLKSECTPRSTRLNPSKIDLQHPFVQAGISLGKTCYGSPTLSDMALMNFPSVKIGPGDSLRSHSSDEFIYINEIQEGIQLYIQMLQTILLQWAARFGRRATAPALNTAK